MKNILVILFLFITSVASAEGQIGQQFGRWQIYTSSLPGTDFKESILLDTLTGDAYKLMSCENQEFGSTILKLYMCWTKMKRTDPLKVPKKYKKSIGNCIK